MDHQIWWFENEEEEGTGREQIGQAVTCACSRLHCQYSWQEGKDSQRYVALAAVGQF